jgi:hypothetical protein
MFSILVLTLSLGFVRSIMLFLFLQKKAEYQVEVNLSQEALWLQEILS